jgi:hypothetical protein
VALFSLLAFQSLPVRVEDRPYNNQMMTEKPKDKSSNQPHQTASSAANKRAGAQVR